MFDMINADINKSFGLCMRSLMKERDVSYRVLARGTGIPVSSLHGYAHNKTGIPLPNAKLIAIFFRVTIDWMLEHGDMLQKKAAV